MNLRIFYVIQPAEPTVLQWLDILRVLANPHARRRAHITVKGPYDEQKNVHDDSNLINGRPLRLIGADAFWDNQQATALLRIGRDDVLEKIWDKPSYPEFNPHISICDKLTRPFTKKVLTHIQGIKPIIFRCGELQPLFSGQGIEVSELLGSINYVLLGRMVGRVLDMELLMQADEELRLEWLGKAVSFQSQLGHL